MQTPAIRPMPNTGIPVIRPKQMLIAANTAPITTANVLGNTIRQMPSKIIPALTPPHDQKIAFLKFIITSFIPTVVFLLHL